MNPSPLSSKELLGSQELYAPFSDYFALLSLFFKL
jgi:hypothetical protein